MVLAQMILKEKFPPLFNLIEVNLSDLHKLHM